MLVIIFLDGDTSEISRSHIVLFLYLITNDLLL